MKFYSILEIVSQLSIILPVATGTIKYKNLSESFRRFYFFLIFSALVEALVAALAEKGIRNDWVIHLYIPVEFFFISMVLSSENSDKKSQRFIKYATLIFIGAWLVYFIGLLGTSLFRDFPAYFRSSLGASQPAAFSVEAVFLTIFSILLLLDLFSEDKLVPITESRRFWFALAVIVYFIGNIVLYPSLNILVETVSEETARNLWAIHSTFNFTHYLFFAVSFLCRK